MTSVSPMYYYRTVKSTTLTQLLILAILLSSSSAGLAAPTEGEPCTIQKLPGRCTASSKCTTLKPAISSGQIKQNDIPSCGLNAFEEVICCPIIATITTMSLPEERPAVRACREIEKNAGIAIEAHVKDGTPAEPGEFPHVAALGYPGIGSEKYAFRCGASLIAPRFLLTATHCIHSPSEEEIPIIVRLGTVNIKNVESTVVDMDIKELHVHPNYTSTYDDIGLVELYEAVSETSFIRMVCLHTPDDKPTNPKYFVTGWGYVNINRDTTDILIKAELAIVPKELCTERFQQVNAFKNGQLAKGISDELVCAQDAKESADACKGDSGGPLNLVFDPIRKRYRVFGIVSTGFSCGGSTPGLYTRVSNYLDYIEKIVWPTG